MAEPPVGIARKAAGMNSRGSAPPNATYYAPKFPAGPTRWRRLISLACYLSVLIVLVVTLIFSADSIPTLTPRSAMLFAAMASLTFPLMAIRGALNTVVFRLGLGVRPFWDGFCFAVWNTSANLFPFSPGLAAKGVLLYRMYGIGVRQYVALTFLVFLTAISASGISALISLSALGSDNFWLWTAFACMSCAAAVMGSNKLKQLLRRMPIFARFLDESVDLDRGWGRLVGAHLVLVCLESVRLMWAFSIAGHAPAFPAIVIMSSGTILMRFANITPGGIGIREGIIVGLASITDAPVDFAFVAAAIDRFAALIGLGVVFLAVASIESLRSRRPDGLNAKRDHLNNLA